MSRPIFSPVAAPELDASSPSPQAECLRHRTFTPGQRIVDGRVFYSAAWLDQRAFSEPPTLRSTRRPRVRPGG